MQEQRSKLDERMMAAVVSSIKAAEVIIAVVDSGEAAGTVTCYVRRLICVEPDCGYTCMHVS
jgi:GTPase Era involved in 16S rRNA processing